MKHSQGNSSTVSKENESKPDLSAAWKEGLFISFEAGYIKNLQMSNP